MTAYKFPRIQKRTCITWGYERAFNVVETSLLPQVSFVMQKLNSDLFVTPQRKPAPLR
jgi:hypothetical protein